MTYGSKDPISGAATRTDVLLAPEDLEALGLRDGDAVVVRSDHGQMRSYARKGPCKRQHIQAFWPEANVLIGRSYDPASGEPDYNAFVTIERP
jgi:formylmethanofuran dehydrogenase subunit D